MNKLNKNLIPDHWYNILGDFPQMFEPFLQPGSNQPIGQDALEPLFAPSLIEQELDCRSNRIPIPEDVRQRYEIWRPTPLIRAVHLERHLNTSCKIYFKYEGCSPVGSHKANSAIAQAYLSKKDGFQRCVAETGAGQWGSAISMASSFYGLDCKVFMVQNSFNSKPARRILMETYGSRVVSSPSRDTQTGRDILQQNPEFPGSLGVAIGEAIETARGDKKTVYTMGSAFNFVCHHQTVIGLELKNQMAQMGISPNYIVSCIGGGSSFAGIAFPFLKDKLEKRLDLEFVAVESTAVPTVTKGEYSYDYGDTAQLTPLMRMYTLGHKFSPPVIHSGGLRYHGLSPLVSRFLKDGHGCAVAYSQKEIFEAALTFARLEGLIPAPETAHGLKAAMDLAVQNRGQNKTIVFCMTGHGFFDLAGYKLFLEGKMEDSTDYAPPAQPPVIAAPQTGGDGFEGWWSKNFGADLKAAPTQGGEPDNRENYKILTASKVERLIKSNQRTVFLPADAIVTPLALEASRALGLDIRKEGRRHEG